MLGDNTPCVETGPASALGENELGPRSNAGDQDNALEPPIERAGSEEEIVVELNKDRHAPGARLVSHQLATSQARLVPDPSSQAGLMDATNLHAT